MNIEDKDYIKKYEPLWGSWYIQELIGEGSFGRVYRITKEEWGFKYESALKILCVPTKEQFREVSVVMDTNENTMMNYFEDSVKNIVNEIRVMYTLRGNSNIVGYEDHNVHKRENPVGWDILIRMEYVNSLPKYIMGKGITKGEVINLGIDICSALETCSQRGIIHRDIKDENIFVSDYGEFKLGDFGISRELSKSGRAASMKGTPLFMAPEVFRGEKYDTRADLYSLGIVLYKLLNCGRIPLLPPYPQMIKYKDSEEALDRRISGEALPIPLEAGTQLGEVILKACCFNPSDRYVSASEMKKELERVKENMSEEELNTILMLPKHRKKSENSEIKSTNLSSSNNVQDTVELTTNRDNNIYLDLDDVFLDDEKDGNPIIEDSLLSKCSEKENVIMESDVHKGPENLESADMKNEEELPEQNNMEQSILNGTVSIFGNQFKKRIFSNLTGNSPGNIINGGLAASQGFWIYYSSVLQGHKLYKIKADGSEKHKLYDDAAWYINVSGNWVYFSNASDEESIYKINIDGNRITKLNSDKSWDITVVDDWIYYSNESDEYTLYRVNTDGSKRTKLNSDKSYCMNVYDNWIYYSNRSSMGNIFKIRTDGTGRTKLNDDNSDYINVGGKYIYYCNNNDNGRLYRINLDGSEPTKLNDDFSCNINLAGDIIYYCNKGDEGKLYKINIDGSGRAKLCNDSCDYINITDNWIFYSNKLDNGRLYRIRHDGSDRAKVDDEDSQAADSDWFYL
ncbi:MAG: DUF5050 domain-containing protein [Bacillota bacterium]